MKKKLLIFTLILILVPCFLLVGCDEIGATTDIQNTQKIANTLAERQPTPTDINFSLERYNLTRRAYWVNGQREKANALVCAVPKPLGYIVLFAGNAPVGRFIVDGKVSSLNSFLTPNAYDNCIAGGVIETIEIADVDGSYGENDQGIFFFTTNGNYIEWTGKYLYSDIPINIDDPIISYQEVN